MAKVEPLKTNPPAPALVPVILETRYISGKRVALRSSPNKDGKVLDRFNNNQKVELLEAGAEWSKVRDTLTRREGYIASRLLRIEPVEAKEKQKEIIGAPLIKPKPVIDRSAIIAAIVQDSISSYSGSCPCPYNINKGGRKCGKSSAYSKPGGYDPICFAQDVTPDMIESYASRN